MQRRPTLSRRAFISRLSGTSIAVSVLAACTTESGEGAREASAMAPGRQPASSCTDVSGLTDEQIEIRKSLQYTDRSPVADKRCNNCKVFKSPASGQPCGGCAVVPGPIHPQGYCTAWVAA